jgi:hypothetical protein
MPHFSMYHAKDSEILLSLLNPYPPPKSVQNGMPVFRYQQVERLLIMGAMQSHQFSAYHTHSFPVM